MITPIQMRAARAILDLSQAEAAKLLGIAPNTLSKIESGQADPPASRIQEIQNYYVGKGIEFIDGDGARKKQQNVRIFEGQNNFWLFFDDVYDVAKNHSNPDICITNVKEAEFDRWLAQYEPIHNERMTQLKGHKLRVLLKENDVHLTSSSYCQYRWMKASQFADASLYLYGDKSAFIQFQQNNVVVTLVESAAVTNSMRKMFEAVWEDSKDIGL